MKKFKTNLIVSILCQLIAVVYGFLLPRLILEQFGSETNGLIQSINQFLAVINFLDMGISQVIRSSLYKPLADKDDNLVSCILLSGSRFYKKIAYGLLGYIIILAFVYPMVVDKNFGWMYIAGLIAVMSIGSFSQYYFGIVKEQLLHASQKSYVIFSVQILSYLINMIVCVWMISANCSIHAIKLVNAIIFLIKPVFYAWYIRKNFNINRKISYTEEPLKQKWHGVAQHISAVVLDSTDMIVLSLFSSLTNVSVYSVYFMIVSNVQNFYQSVVMYIQSAAGAIWVKQEQKEIYKNFCLIELGLHAVTVFLFSCMGILIIPFVKIYTDGLTDANYIQPIFAAVLVTAYGIRCLRTPYNIWILAAGHFKETYKCHITAAVLNLSASVIAVFYLGLVGVAVGTLIAMCFQTVWMMCYTARNLVKCNFLHILKQFSADIVMVISICFLTANITLQNTSYFDWFVMAMQVALISIICIISVICIFYPKEIKCIINKFIKNTLKSVPKGLIK